MKLLTAEQHAILLANGRRQQEQPGFDPYPVVKLFTPDGACTWLLTELDPDDTDIAFGLCDLGMGFPELGSVRLSELASARGALGLRIERDVHWQPSGPISAYTDAAFKAEHIVELPQGGAR